MSVDLPEPDGPMIAVNAPAGSSRVTPASASTAASPSPKRRCRSTAVTIGGVVTSGSFRSGERSRLGNLRGGKPDACRRRREVGWQAARSEADPTRGAAGCSDGAGCGGDRRVGLGRLGRAEDRRARDEQTSALIGARACGVHPHAAVDLERDALGVLSQKLAQPR